MNDKKKETTSVATPAAKVAAATSDPGHQHLPATPEIIMVPTTVGLTGEQFFKLQRTLMFGLALAPVIAANPNITPTPRNIERVVTFAELILKIVNGEQG